MIHGVGAETPTQVVLFLTAAGVNGRVGGVAVLVASDADVEVTVRLGPGEVEVRNGRSASADLVVAADSSLLIGLAGTPLRLGLPDGLERAGRAVLRDLAAGRIRVHGGASHPRLLRRLTMLLSVQ